MSGVSEAISGVATGIPVPLALVAALMLAGVAPALVLLAGAVVAVALALREAAASLAEGAAAAAHHAAERAREEEESQLYPERERWEVAAILHRYGVRGAVLHDAVEAIAADRRRWVDFMMRFELDLMEPDPSAAHRRAGFGGLGVLAGGLLPILPLAAGLPLSAALAAGAAGLLAAGWLRAAAAGHARVPGAMMALGGGLLATAGAVMAALLLG
jgi:hypothetical protein